MQKSFYRVWSLPGPVSETDSLMVIVDTLLIRCRWKYQPYWRWTNMYLGSLCHCLASYACFPLSVWLLKRLMALPEVHIALVIGCIPVPGCEMRINIGQSHRNRHLANHTVIHPQNSWSQASPSRNGPKPANSASFRRKTIPRKYLGRKNV